MGKRILALLLAGILSVAAIPAETSAKEQSDGALAEWKSSVGGIEERKMIEITEKEGRTLGILEAETWKVPQEEGMSSLMRDSQKYDTSWDIYSSNYIYNRLDKKEKKVWDALDKLCRTYLTTNKDARHYGVKDKNGNIYWCYIMDPVPYSAKELTEDKVYMLISLFTYANPQYYFLDGPLSVYNGSIWLIVHDEFGKGKNRKASTLKMKKAIDKMEKEIAKGKTDIEKARIAYDLIIRRVAYDLLNQTPFEKSPYHQSAYSVLGNNEDARYTVCTGYAMAYELLMNGAGIDTLVVLSETHAWNMVCLNQSWYNLDCTWGDQIGADGTEGIYRYFCRSTYILNQLDPKGNHKISPVYEKYFPKCTRDSKATDTSIGTYEEPASVSQKPKISQKKVSDGILVTIKTADPGAEIYYTLDGKKPSASFTRCHLYKKPFKVSEPVTVKAVAVRDGKENSKISTVKINSKVYKVKFDSRGGSKVKTQKVFANSRVKKPSVPKRRGYKFAGWYQDKKCTKTWDFKKKVAKNIVLYARWK